MNKRLPFSKSERENILNMILDSYFTAPEQLEAALPQIAQHLSLILPRKSHKIRSFGLTEKERTRYSGDLLKLIVKLGKGSLSRDQAIQALEECVALVKDNSLPVELSHDVLAKLVKQVIGMTPSGVQKRRNFPIRDGSASEQIALLRGVLLNNTWDNCLLSIDINPSKVKERRRIVSFVGSAKDSEANVAERHNMYI